MTCIVILLQRSVTSLINFLHQHGHALWLSLRSVWFHATSKQCMACAAFSVNDMLVHFQHSKLNVMTKSQGRMSYLYSCLYSTCKCCSTSPMYSAHKCCSKMVCVARRTWYAQVYNILKLIWASTHAKSFTARQTPVPAHEWLATTHYAYRV